MNPYKEQTHPHLYRAWEYTQKQDGLAFERRTLIEALDIPGMSWDRTTRLAEAIEAMIDAKLERRK